MAGLDLTNFFLLLQLLRLVLLGCLFDFFLFLFVRLRQSLYLLGFGIELKLLELARDYSA